MSIGIEEVILLVASKMTEESFSPEIGEAFDKWHDYMIDVRKINLPKIG